MSYIQYYGSKIGSNSNTYGAQGIWDTDAQYSFKLGTKVDPLLSSTSLLLRAEGSGNTFTDSSSNNLTITAAGNITHSNTVFKFDGGSMSLDGTGDYLYITDTAATTGVLDFAAGQFCVEAWVYFLSFVSGANTIAGGVGATNGDWMFAARANNQLSFGRSFIAWDATTTGITFVANKWYHVAATRDSSNILRLFVDGVPYYSATNTQTYNIANTYLGIGTRQSTTGTLSPGEFFHGYIDELRITKGAPRYTAFFEVPKYRF